MTWWTDVAGLGQVLANDDEIKFNNYLGISSICIYEQTLLLINLIKYQDYEYVHNYPNGPGCGEDVSVNVKMPLIIWNN